MHGEPDQRTSTCPWDAFPQPGIDGRTCVRAEAGNRPLDGAQRDKENRTKEMTDAFCARGGHLRRKCTNGRRVQIDASIASCHAGSGVPMRQPIMLAYALALKPQILPLDN